MSFDKSKYKVWTWKNPLVLHWIINPGLAFNELLLGQRVPKITLIEKDSKKPLAERTFVPCPYCGTLHSSLKWTPQNNTAFKNWFGLYCDNCHKIIPCVRNLTSLVVIVLTFPVWYWFKDRWKQDWLKTQEVKFSKPLVLTQPEFKWWYVGLRFAFFMFVITSLFNYVFFREEFTWKSLFLDSVSWIIGGLIFGIVMKKISGSNLSNRGEKKTQQAT